MYHWFWDLKTRKIKNVASLILFEVSKPILEGQQHCWNKTELPRHHRPITKKSTTSSLLYPNHRNGCPLSLRESEKCFTSEWLRCRFQNPVQELQRRYGWDLHFWAKLKCWASNISFPAFWWISLQQFVPYLHQVMVQMSWFMQRKLFGHWPVLIIGEGVVTPTPPCKLCLGRLQHHNYLIQNGLTHILPLINIAPPLAIWTLH